VLRQLHYTGGMHLGFLWKEVRCDFETVVGGNLFYGSCIKVQLYGVEITSVYKIECNKKQPDGIKTFFDLLYNMLNISFFEGRVKCFMKY